MPKIQTSDHVAHYFGTIWQYFGIIMTKPKEMGTGSLELERTRRD